MLRRLSVISLVGFAFQSQMSLASPERYFCEIASVTPFPCETNEPCVSFVPSIPNFVIDLSTGDVKGEWFTNEPSMYRDIQYKGKRTMNFRLVSTIKFPQKPGYMYLEIQDRSRIGLPNPQNISLPYPFVAVYNDWKVLGGCGVEIDHPKK